VSNSNFTQGRLQTSGEFRHKSQAPLRLFRGRIDGDDFHHGFACFGDHERLTFRGLLDEAGQMRFRFVHVDGAHGRLRMD
jgi:hypothetical protein